MKQGWYKNNVKFYTKPILKFSCIVLILSLFLDEILMPRDSPPIMQNAFYRFSSTRLCTMLFAGFSAVCWFSCFLSCHARNVRWFGGIVVRGCVSRSLLGSYVHQELI